MRSAWAERSPSAALEPRRGCPKNSPPPPRAIAAMFFGEICDSIRGKIDCRQKIKPKSDRLLAKKAFLSHSRPGSLAQNT